MEHNEYRSAQENEERTRSYINRQAQRTRIPTWDTS